MEIVFKKHVERVACGNSAGMKRESRREWVCFWSVERRLRERESLEILLRDRSKKLCLLRDCWATVERLLRERECWESVWKLLLRDCWGNGSVREVWESAVRLLTELKHLSTAFNIPNSTQATSPQQSSNISQNHSKTSLRHLSNISQHHPNVSQTSLKHLSTTLINIHQTILDNITLIITNQN